MYLLTSLLSLCMTVGNPPASNDYELAKSYRLLKEYEKALTYYLPLLETKDSTNAILLREIGLTYVDLQEYDLSIQYYNKAIFYADQEDAPQIYANRAQVYNITGRPDMAIEDCNRALQIDSSYEGAFVIRGIAYDKGGKSEKAIQEYDKAIAEDSMYAMAYAQKGLALYHMDRDQEALIYLNKATTIKKNYGLALHWTGLVYDEIGEYTKAIEYFTQAIEADPTLLEPHMMRGIVYMYDHNSRLACEDFYAALRLARLPSAKEKIKAMIEAAGCK